MPETTSSARQGCQILVHYKHKCFLESIVALNCILLVTFTNAL